MRQRVGWMGQHREELQEGVGGGSDTQRLRGMSVLPLSRLSPGGGPWELHP